MEEKPDVFGPYGPGMTAVHASILEAVSSARLGTRGRLETMLLQCTWGEYLEESHDQGYAYSSLRLGTVGGAFLLGSNNALFPDAGGAARRIAGWLDQAWRGPSGVPVSLRSAVPEIGQWDLPRNHMIQSVHVLDQNSRRSDGVHSVQLFKVIYPYRTLEPFLDRIKQL